MFRKVLIPIDGSEYSLKALEIAAKITDPRKGVAVVVTVIEPGVMQLPQTYLERLSMYDSSLPTGIIPKGSHDEGIERAELIVTKAHEILTSAGIKTEMKILRGKPVKSIIESAKEEKADLIIIGSHGLGGLSKLLLGSVSSKVVEEAPCSVLVVRRR
ncbi:MAG: universal stress protein [Thermoprotei archaeon]|nr:universal stress protein [TACK group archaeon]